MNWKDDKNLCRCLVQVAGLAVTRYDESALAGGAALPAGAWHSTDTVAACRAALRHATELLDRGARPDTSDFIEVTTQMERAWGWGSLCAFVIDALVLTRNVVQLGPGRARHAGDIGNTIYTRGTHIGLDMAAIDDVVRYWIVRDHYPALDPTSDTFLAILETYRITLKIDDCAELAEVS